MSAPKQYPSVHVYSDGTPNSTRVVGPDGQQIPNVRAISIYAEAGLSGEFSIELKLNHGKLDLDGPVHVLVFQCPFCSHSHEHKCVEHL